MLLYTLKRLFFAVVAIVGVSMIVFVATRASGDVVTFLLPPQHSLEDRINLTARLGLDKPIPVQYLIFAGNAIRGDFGDSYRWHQPAISLVLDRLPATLELTMASLALAWLVALPIGVMSARWPGSIVDTLGKGIALLGQAMPTFWIGLLLMWLFAVQWRLLPTGGRGDVQQLILPAVTLGWYSVAALTRITRSAMLDVLNSEYVRVARAKGAPEHLVVWKHALRNACIPVVTILGVQVATLLGGSVIVETIFTWPGVGRTIVEAVFARDYMVTQAGVLMISVFFVTINLLVDLSYAVINPRIRFS